MNLDIDQYTVNYIHTNEIFDTTSILIVNSTSMRKAMMCRKHWNNVGDWSMTLLRKFLFNPEMIPVHGVWVADKNGDRIVGMTKDMTRKIVSKMSELWTARDPDIYVYGDYTSRIHLPKCLLDNKYNIIAPSDYLEEQCQNYLRMYDDKEHTLYELGDSGPTLCHHRHRDTMQLSYYFNEYESYICRYVTLPVEFDFPATQLMKKRTQTVDSTRCANLARDLVKYWSKDDKYKRAIIPDWAIELAHSS